MLDAVNEITIRVCIPRPVVLFLDSLSSVRQFIHGFIICLLHGDVLHHLVLANRLVGVGESKKDDQSK